MLRKLNLLVALLWSVVPWVAVWGQEQQPSLGDVARQARKDKEKNAGTPRKVITEDNLPSSKALSGLSDLGSSQGSGGESAMAKGLAAIDKVEATFDKLDPLDRSTLAKAALLGNDVAFPERRAWEDKLYSAKQQYVSHGRELMREVRRILSDAQSLRAAPGGQERLSPNDPRAQEIVRRIRETIEDAVRTDAAYQAVVMEGWDRAKQAKN